MIFSAKTAAELPPASSSSAGLPSLCRLIEERLRTSPYLALKGITCELIRGVLYLRGQVSSYYLKQVAQNVAGQVVCDRLVNEIEVTTRPARSETGLPLGRARFTGKSSALISD